VDAQLLINWVVGALGVLFGGVLKALWDAVRDLQEEDRKIAERVQSIDLLVAGKYVTREELERITNMMFKKLDYISDKLDSKLDRLSNNHVV